MAVRLVGAATQQGDGARAGKLAHLRELHLRLGPFEVRSVEAGVIPMTDARFARRVGPAVHRIGAVYLAGLALGSAAAHVVVDGDTAHLRGADDDLERCPYPVAA